MDDSELQRIRAARLAELQSQSSSSTTQGQSGHGQGQNQASASDDEAQRHAQLSQILSSGARDRLRRIALVKPDRARSVEDLILRMARTGQIRQRVSEDELVGLLNEISGQQETERKTGIKNLRRDESDDDWD